MPMPTDSMGRTRDGEQEEARRKETSCLGEDPWPQKVCGNLTGNLRTHMLCGEGTERDNGATLEKQGRKAEEVGSQKFQHVL